MKKNKMMRIASVLLVAVLISTCAISGTFAKYVTKASGEDKARVAKWGIIVDLENGTMFDTKYKTHDQNGYKGEFSVVSSNEEKLVAPGTSSKDLDKTLVAKITGTPEVAARYTIEGKVSDVVLAAGTYTDYTQLVKADDGTYGYTGEFTLDKNYSPVKWNLEISGKGKTINVATELYNALPADLLTVAENYGLTREGCSFFDAITILGKVADNDTYKQVVERALGSIVSKGSNFQLEADKDAGTFKMSYDFDPNKDMDFTFTLSWAWAFEQADVELYDKADTFLGNWAAVELGDEIEGFVAPAAPSSLEINATLTATATQID